MDKTQKREIVDVLNENEKNKSYVYALCEKKTDGTLTPFYIGKGEGDRVWAHEEGAEAEKKYLEEHCTIEELEEELEKISAKHKKINSIKKENIVKVIIKCGMTSQEAFMAEGSLINLFSMEGLTFCSKDNYLTNKQSGHSSEGEKIQGIDSKARTIDEFYNECAREPICIDDLEAKVMLRNINRAYPDCKKLKSEEDNNKAFNEAIRESVRGFWREGNPKRMDYLFAVYAGKIIGVYKVKNRNPDGSLIKNLYTILDSDRNDYPYYKGLSIREKDKELSLELKKEIKEIKLKNKIINKDYSNLFSLLSPECQQLCKKAFNPDNKTVGKNYYKDELKKLLCRKYYVVEEIPKTDKFYKKFKDCIGRSVYEYSRNKKGEKIYENGKPKIERAFKKKVTFIYSDRYINRKK